MLSTHPFCRMFGILVAILLKLATALDSESLLYTPNPPLHSIPDAAAGLQDITRNFVSATFGSNMVLQRDTEAAIWGYASKGETVTLTLQDTKTSTKEGMTNPPRLTLTTTAGDDGFWRRTLPPHEASLEPTDITVATPSQKAVLKNVLFGDVYLCGGQSNMQFALPAQTGGQEEANAGNAYPHIRLFTVGQGTWASQEMPDLQTIEQPWSVASNATLLGNGGFGYFSAVCWYFGKTVANGLQNQVPIGLISNNWGGTKVELWQPGGDLYNSMIHPYLLGPMALTGFTWYQGEANTKDQASADSYAQLFPDMITSWRQGFQIPNAYFGFVQLSTWCPQNPLAVAELRQAQMAALKLQGEIGYATNADHGDACNVHPTEKQYCGQRLGASALALQYGQQIQWKSPTYAKAKAPTAIKSLRRIINSGSETPTIIIMLNDVSDKGLYLLDNPYNNLPSKMNCTRLPANTCAGSSVLLNGKGWVTATVSIHSANQVMLTADSGDANSDKIVATSYGWGAVPFMNVYDKGTDLPLLPWNEKV